MSVFDSQRTNHTAIQDWIEVTTKAAGLHCSIFFGHHFKANTSSGLSYSILESVTAYLVNNYAQKRAVTKNFVTAPLVLENLFFNPTDNSTAHYQF